MGLIPSGSMEKDERVKRARANLENCADGPNSTVPTCGDLSDSSKDVLSLASELETARETHRREQRASADRLRKALEDRQVH